MIDRLAGIDYLRDAIQMDERQSVKALTDYSRHDNEYHYIRGRLDLARHLLGLLDYAYATEQEAKKKAGG